MLRKSQRRTVVAGATALALLAGAVIAARPAVHLVRRTHAAATARAEWMRWVKAARAETGVGEPAGWITVDAIGLDTIVLLGDTKENLQRFPCLSRLSISFAQPDFVKVVAAHRDTHFRRLGEISLGDRVRIMLKDGRVQTYRVCDMEVVPRETAARRVAEKDGGDWLVLMTCHPFSFAGAAPERFLVWASREGERPSRRPDSQSLLRRAGGRPSTFTPPPGAAGGAGTSPVHPALLGRAASFAIDDGEGDGSSFVPLPGATGRRIGGVWPAAVTFCPSCGGRFVT